MAIHRFFAAERMSLSLMVCCLRSAAGGLCFQILRGTQISIQTGLASWHHQLPPVRALLLSRQACSDALHQLPPMRAPFCCRNLTMGSLRSRMASSRASKDHLSISPKSALPSRTSAFTCSQHDASWLLPLSAEPTQIQGWSGLHRELPATPPPSSLGTTL